MTTTSAVFGSISFTYAPPFISGAPQRKATPTRDGVTSARIPGLLRPSAIGQSEQHGSLTAKRGRSEQRVIRQLDRDGVEISVERAVRMDPEHAATAGIFQSVDVDIVEYEVRGGRVRPYINRIVVAAE